MDNILVMIVGKTDVYSFAFLPSNSTDASLVFVVLLSTKCNTWSAIDGPRQ